MRISNDNNWRCSSNTHDSMASINLEIHIPQPTRLQTIKYRWYFDNSCQVISRLHYRVANNWQSAAHFAALMFCARQPNHVQLLSGKIIICYRKWKDKGPFEMWTFTPEPFVRISKRAKVAGEAWWDAGRSGGGGVRGNNNNHTPNELRN